MYASPAQNFWYVLATKTTKWQKREESMNYTDILEHPEFPFYLVRSDGAVLNGDTGVELKPSFNAQGVGHVALYHEGRQYRRAVAKMVAEAFVENPRPDQFDTPIHIDGDRSNCRADNLMWRPRWFAIAYHKQFKTPHLIREFDIKAYVVHTGETLTFLDISQRYGVLVDHLGPCAFNETRVPLGNNLVITIFPDRHR